MVNIRQTATDYAPGERIADYQVLSRIGGGSYGCVYLVKDITEAVYALKILRNGTEQEFSALMKLRKIQHCHGMTAIHAAGHMPDGRIYYLMDAADNLLTDGGYLPDTLANRLARNGRLRPREILDLAAALLPAVKHLHEQGAAHHDIKPENIIFSNNMPLLADFGSLSDGGSPDEFPSSSLGFFPPEELNGTVNGHFSPKNDLYAFGMTLYCAWSGHGPEAYPELPDNADITDVKIIRKLFQTSCNQNPAYRFQNAEDFIKAVEKAQKELLSPENRKRKIIFTCILAAACVSAFAGLIIFMFRIHAEKMRKNWQLAEQRVALAEMAEEAGILENLKYAGKTVDREYLESAKVLDSMPQFQQLHDLLTEYRKWKNAAENEKKDLVKKIISMAKRCPKSYTNPTGALIDYCIEKTELSQEEEQILNRLDSMIRYRQLKLEIDSCRRNPNLSSRERKDRLGEKEARLETLKKEYEIETGYIDLAYALESSPPEPRTVLELREKFDTLKEQIKLKYAL